MEHKCIFRDYIHDVGVLIKEYAIEAKMQRVEHAGKDDYLYKSGYNMALMTVLSLMQQQAVDFDIPFDLLGIGGIDPERDLL